MATIEFTEYRFAGLRYGAMAQLPDGREVATQQVTIGTASASSEPFNARTELIVVTSVGAACRIAIGAEAAAMNHAPLSRLLAEGSEYAFAVVAGDVLAVIEALDTVDPVINSAAAVSLAEGLPLAHLLTVADPDEAVTWTLTGGADVALFELAPDGVTLRFLADAVQDFSAPIDADTNNTYVVQVTATDAAGNSAAQTVTVTITDVA